MKEKKPFNPLDFLWRAFQRISSVYGVATFSQGWIQWKGFVLEGIEFIRGIVHPVYKFLLGWVWFEVPIWLYDYIFLGTIIFGSIVRATFVRDFTSKKLLFIEIFRRKSRFSLKNKSRGLQTKRSTFRGKVESTFNKVAHAFLIFIFRPLFYFGIVILFWPIVLLILWGIYSYSDNKYSKPKQSKNKDHKLTLRAIMWLRAFLYNFFVWLGATIFFFILLVVINQFFT